jgi:hypothetical protein
LYFSRQFALRVNTQKNSVFAKTAPNKEFNIVNRPASLARRAGPNSSSTKNYAMAAKKCRDCAAALTRPFPCL